MVLPKKSQSPGVHKLRESLAAIRESRDRELPFEEIWLHDFEFISENSQIAAVHEFMESLPERLMGLRTAI